MYKIKRLLYFHIMLLIYFIFICSQTQIQATSRTRLSRTTTTTTTTPISDEPTEVDTETETETETEPETTTRPPRTTTAKPTTTTTTSTPDEYDSGNENRDSLHLSDEEIKQYHDHLIKEYKSLAKEVLFGLKGTPGDPVGSQSPTRGSSKAYVPRAMLDEYMSLRNEVREIIPDDRDFMGKIDIDDLDQTHDEIWTQIYNKYGSYDIQVDMGTPEGGIRSHFRGEATHRAYITPQSEPEDVPTKFEPYLPPISRSLQNQKQFISVHLRFNLSQEVYTRPEAADELTGAELFLARDRLYDCRFHDCNNKHMPMFKSSSSSSSSSTLRSRSQDERRSDHDRAQYDMGDPENIDMLQGVPRYQRVYVLQVFDYDQYGEPVSKILSSLRIDTSQTTPIIFNISPIVKSWLINPKKNYGIIVRVTNDDPVYDKLVELQRMSRRRMRPSRSLSISGDSNRTTTNVHINETDVEGQANSSHPSEIHMYDFVVPPEVAVAEHVRLKRTFRETSDNEYSWLRKQPSIYVYSKPTDTSRNHVKRHNMKNEDEEEEDERDRMQADDPDVTTRDYMSTSSSTSSPSGSTEDGVTMTSSDKPISAHPLGAGSQNRHRDNVVNGRRSSSSTSSSSSSTSMNKNSAARGGQSQSNARPRGKVKPSPRQAEKCSKRSMTINFEEVGWTSWIIAPLSYQANYCSGDCSWPLSDTQNATNHAIIQAIYHSVGRVVPRSCCAPVKLGKMAILYQLDGIVQMRQYDDMIVEACGCL